MSLDSTRTGDCSWVGPLPVGAPGKVTLFGRDAAGKYVVMPPDTEWTVGEGDEVVSARRSTGSTVLVSGKSEGTGSFSVSAKTATGTLSMVVQLSMGPSLAAPTLQGYIVPSDVPAFLSDGGIGDWAGQAGHLLLPVGNTTEPRMLFQGTSATGTDHRCDLKTADLTTVERQGGDAVEVAGKTITGKKAGVGQVTTTLKLPGAAGKEPFVLANTFDVHVTEPLPTSRFQVASEGGVYDAVIVHVGECKPYHLLETHGDLVNNYYYSTRAWSDATVTASDPSAITVAAGGTICGKTPGNSTLTVSLDTFTKTIPVAVWLPDGQTPLLRVEPDPVLIPDAMNDGCVDVHVFAKLGDAAEADISKNPVLSVVAISLKTEDPTAYDLWASCSASESDGVRCCSHAASFASNPEAPDIATLPMAVYASYLNGGGQAKLAPAP